jgi:hypothetical protein
VQHLAATTHQQIEKSMRWALIVADNAMRLEIIDAKPDQPRCDE